MVFGSSFGPSMILDVPQKTAPSSWEGPPYTCMWLVQFLPFTSSCPGNSVGYWPVDEEGVVAKQARLIRGKCEEEMLISGLSPTPTYQ